ncbi:NAD-dependent epimerase/dehydratase family protein [Mesorhizobium sp. NBSH29]|nr:NAD-dependent epimerase/dehydratase family protein [Mesorhizobium sp. NBSH29]
MLRALVTLYDLALAALSFLAAYVVAYGVPLVYFIPGIPAKAAAFTAICALCFVSFSVTRGSWRYVSIPEVLAVIKAVIFAVAIYTVGAFLVSRGDNVPRSVPILTALFLIAGLTTSRLAYRMVMDGLRVRAFGGVGPNPRTGRNVLICGINDEAEGFIRTTQRSRIGQICVVGIIDDAGVALSRSVQGVPVLGNLNNLELFVKRLRDSDITVNELVIAERRPTRQRLSEILEMAATVRLKVSRLPDFTETASVTSTSLFEPKPIELGDLLGRPETHSDVEGVARLINDKVVLATGAGGSIGSELCRQIAAFGPRRLIITDASEYNIYMLDKELRQAFPQVPITSQIVNVRDAGRVTRLFAEIHPEVVFHAAALKHVPLVEDNPVEGIKTNVLGTRNVADAALANKAAIFVMISTDKAVNPTNIMGATKRAAEAYCQSLDVSGSKTRFKTVRFGNVLGSNGSVVPRFQEQIAAGGPITVTHPHIVRYFMTIPEAVRLVLHASAQAIARHAERGKIMVLDMGKPIRIVDLAERMIQLAGFKRSEIDIVFTGLRPGEKLYEELFDPSEVQDSKTEDGFVMAAPRVIDKALLLRTMSELDGATQREDAARAIELLSHIVPEYKPAPVNALDEEDLSAGVLEIDR